MFIYNLVILLYGFVIKLASFRKIKARQWVNGRKNWREIYKEKISKLNPENRIWIHCASYGEFEQGRTLIDAIKIKHPSYKIILTFFSPSGYEAFKDWPGADVICYLPLDTRSNAVDFINIVKPKTVIFIKYEFWINYLFELKKQQIATYLVSAVFKPHHPFFKWYGRIFIRSLSSFSGLLIQDKKSGELLESIGVKNYKVIGDTRFDRVLQVKNNHVALPYFENFCKGNKIIIAGSTWEQDEELLINTFDKLKTENIKLIIVPHEVNQKTIDNLISTLNKKEFSFLLHSQQQQDDSKKVLIVDSVGLLSKLYFYAHVAYIGGGFNGGLHNSLEASVYGVPVTFYGNEFERYNEVVELMNLGAAKNVMNEEELLHAIKTYLYDEAQIKKVKHQLKSFFENNSNITGKVLAEIRL